MGLYRTSHPSPLTSYFLLLTSDFCPSLLPLQSLFQISDDILRVLDAAAQAKKSVRDPDLRASLYSDPLVRRETRLGYERLHTREAWRMDDQLEPLEHALGGFGSSLE